MSLGLSPGTAQFAQFGAFGEMHSLKESEPFPGVCQARHISSSLKGWLIGDIVPAGT